jgi:hypothetical protein
MEIDVKITCHFDTEKMGRGDALLLTHLTQKGELFPKPYPDYLTDSNWPAWYQARMMIGRNAGDWLMKAQAFSDSVDNEPAEEVIACTDQDVLEASTPEVLAMRFVALPLVNDMPAGLMESYRVFLSETSKKIFDILANKVGFVAASQLIINASIMLNGVEGE